MSSQCFTLATWQILTCIIGYLCDASWYKVETSQSINPEGVVHPRCQILNCKVILCCTCNVGVILLDFYYIGTYISIWRQPAQRYKCVRDAEYCQAFYHFRFWKKSKKYELLITSNVFFLLAATMNDTANSHSSTCHNCEKFDFTASFISCHFYHLHKKR